MFEIKAGEVLHLPIWDGKQWECRCGLTFSTDEKASRHSERERGFVPGDPTASELGDGIN